MRVCVSLPRRGLLLFGAISLSLWVKAACLFIKQAVKSASYQLALANVAVINSACLLSLTEDYPEVYGWFTEVADTLPIFLAPVLSMSVCCVWCISLSYWLNELLNLSSFKCALLFFYRDSLLINTRLKARCGSDHLYLGFYKEIYIFQENVMVSAGSNVNIYKCQYLLLLISHQNLSCIFKCIFL